MAKSNEYVGVDEKYIPEEEQSKTHVQEPIIGSENAQKIRDGITGGVNKLTSDEGKEKVKRGAKKGLKVAKGVGIGFLVPYFIMGVLVIIMIVVMIVRIIKTQERHDEFMNNSNKASSSVVENLNLRSGVKWSISVSDDLEEIYTNNKAGEHLITVVNGGVSTTDSQEIRALANAIENESMKKYDITVEYGDDGYVKTYTFEEF